MMCCHLFPYMTVRLWEVFVSHNWMGEDATGERMAMAAAREGSITRLHPAGLLTADIDWQRMI
jgi:hypothetical protein